MGNISYMMVDIETTGKTPGCGILAIGAVTFGPFDIRRQEFYKGIKWDPLNPDFCDEKDTMDWWRQQDPSVARLAFAGEHSYENALILFSKFIEAARLGHEGFRLYANGAAFDFPILEYAYRAVGLNIPWRYHERQCYSTLKRHFPRIPKPKFIGNAHNALDDAKNQAAHCEAILKFIS